MSGAIWATCAALFVAIGYLHIPALVALAAVTVTAAATWGWRTGQRRQGVRVRRVL